MLVHTQEGKSLPQFMAQARGSVASVAPAANSGPDRSVKVLHTCCLGGSDHSKHVRTRLWQLHSSHASV